MNRQIDKRIEGLATLREVAKVYGKISAVRMQKIRQSVLLNRIFSEGMDDIFKQVLYTYSREIEKKGGKRTDGRTFLANNGRVVSVFISANTGLYGDIISRTFELFYEGVKGADVEVAIVGRLGRRLFLESFPGRPYTYFDLPDYKPESKYLTDIVRHLVQYKEINVYFGKFQNIVSQKPDKLIVSREVQLPKESMAVAVKYIFEPSMEGVLKFFEGEIFGSTLNQVVNESQLAKLASRALAMDRAEQNISKDIEKVQLEKLRLVHRARNKGQMGILSSVFAKR